MLRGRTEARHVDGVSNPAAAALDVSLAAPFATIVIIRGDGKKARSPADPRESTKETVKTNRAGNAGISGEPVVDLSAFFHSLHAELRVPPAPGIPCALFSEGRDGA